MIMTGTGSGRDSVSGGVKIEVIGKKMDNPSLWLTAQGKTGELFPDIKASGIELASESARGTGLRVLEEIPAGALVEVELDGDLHFWTTAEDLRERLSDPDTFDARSVSHDGSAWTVPSSLDLPGAERGFFGKLALTALRWLDIHPDHDLRDTIVERAQNRAIPTEGLFPVRSDGSLGPRLTAPIPDGGPVLILLHGTASSTAGSFSRLWTDQTDKWKALCKQFGDRIYALEHWTLTRSPIENALLVARLLPKKGTLSFLSHSRGGLIGELLCLDPAEFDLKGALATLDAEKTRDTSANAAIDKLKKELEQLIDELIKRPGLSVDRFVRAACPSRGTSLAGDKLDKFSSLLVLAAIVIEMKASGKRSFGVSAAQLIGIGVDALWETVAAVLASRRRPDELPGLQAMMPGSSLVSIINTSRGRGDLYVIAGDAAPVDGDRFAALRIWLADRYYERDHDLVVDTRSMLDGTQRSRSESGPRCKVLFRSGADVNHFSYFRNEDSATAAAAALTHADDADSLFKDYLGEWPLADGTGEHARGWLSPRNQKDPTDPDLRGTVILIPGLCGSELLVNENETWANLLALAGGAFCKKLNIDSAVVTAGGPLADSYVPLANTLRQRGYKVTMHGYDWRKSLNKALPALKKVIDAALKATIDSRKPVHFVVHSMGGVLLRAAFASDKDLWERWNNHPGDPRVLMLGTPNQGSHAITLLLTGRDTFFRQLALLDFCHSQEELLKTAIHFPGVMELLPFTDNGDDKAIRELATWEAFKKADGKDKWPLPIADVLAESGKIWRTLGADPLLSSSRLVYVAGMADQTPDKALIDAKGRFQLMATPEGDGRVPWATGIPKSCKDNQRAYYVRAAHGDLPKASDAYDGYLDILERGRTDKLASQPPAARGSTQPQVWRTEESEAALFPSRGELLAAATGGTLRSARKGSRSGYRAEVRVLHGDLLYAESAVMVGHSWGATSLEFTEKLLDQALGGRMQRRLNAGLHAGALGTYALYRRKGDDKYAKEAIVIGIGRIGQLSGGQLSLAVSRAVAAYAAEVLEDSNMSGETRDEPISLGVSTLLIGAGIGELTLPDSVAAIMRGHRDARLRLERAGLASQVRLDRLDFIEVLEDKAIHALRSARDTVDVDTELARAFFVDAAIRPHTGHRRRATATVEDGLWQRIAISAIGGDNGTAPRLMFDVYGELARAERTYNAVPFKDIERFTESLMANTVDQEQVGRALFELLVPNWLKDLAPDRRRTQLILDKTAAAYPWELLRDRATDHEGGSGQPLSVRSGLIRQLSTGQFRLNVRRTNDFKALVVGDPDLGEWARFMRPLDGAVKEARAVATRLESAGIVPSLHIQDEARQILLDLFSDEWRILHLSGHGIYQQNIPATESLDALKKGTGMAIGGGDLLTPAHVEQMRAVPDFVFINCCNLGRIEETAITAIDGTSRPASVRPGNPSLAANLATQLIEIGVRCVIAAGWEVRDDAAQLFAETFYDRFLSGDSFGDSVQAARLATFEQYRSSNTWGAYQCYGDPGFVLARPQQATAKDTRKTPRYDYLSPTEVLYELERLTLRAGFSRDLDKDAAPSPERHSKPLLALCERQGWIFRGDILEAFGKLYAEYSLHQEAIEFYRRALSAPDGRASRRAEEQLANMLTRKAKSLAEQGERAVAKGAGSESAASAFAEAFDLLNRATAILSVTDADRLPSAERLNLQAAIEKRRLLCHIKAGDRQSVPATLDAMLNFSNRATDKAREEGGDLSYPALNAANACALGLLAGAESAVTSRSRVEQTLKALREAESATTAKDFWGKAARADLLLAEGLFALAKSGKGKNKLDEAQSAYRALMAGQVSPRERESVSTTIDILLLVVSHLTPVSGQEAAAASVKSALEEIAKALKP